MNTHQVTLNGQPVATARDHYNLTTIVFSAEHHDESGHRFIAHQLTIEGFNATGSEVTDFISPLRLKKGDVIQITIGETS